MIEPIVRAMLLTLLMLMFLNQQVLASELPSLAKTYPDNPLPVSVQLLIAEELEDINLDVLQYVKGSPDRPEVELVIQWIREHQSEEEMDYFDVMYNKQIKEPCKKLTKLGAKSYADRDGRKHSAKDAVGPLLDKCKVLRDAAVKNNLKYAYLDAFFVGEKAPRSHNYSACLGKCGKKVLGCIGKEFCCCDKLKPVS